MQSLSNSAECPRAAELFESFVPRLPENLLPAGAVASLRDATQKLPRISGMILELHLGTSQPRADLSLRLRRDELQSPLAGTAFYQSAWRPLHELLSCWSAEPAPAVLSGVENVWVELDLGAAYDMKCAPSIFFDIDRAGRLSVDEQLAACGVVLRYFSRVPPPEVRDQLARALTLGLPALRLYYLGLMLSRNIEGYRVCLLGDRADAILPYLDRIGWSGARARIAELLIRHASAADKLILDLDIDSSVHESLGLEIFFDAPHKWQEFLSGLERDELCRCDEARSLLEWRSKRPHGRLNHVKLSYQPNQPLRAKAYLYLSA